MDKGHPQVNGGRDMRKRNGVILAVIGYIVFFFCMEGWGANWKVIGEDVGGSIWEIDLTSIFLQPNNFVRVLVKQIHSRKSAIDWVKKYGEQYKDFSHSINLEEYQCTENKRRILSFTQYSLGGEIIFLDNAPGEWMSVPLNSIAGVILKEVCK